MARSKGTNFRKVVTKLLSKLGLSNSSTRAAIDLLYFAKSFVSSALISYFALSPLITRNNNDADHQLRHNFISNLKTLLIQLALLGPWNSKDPLYCIEKCRCCISSTHSSIYTKVTRI